MIQIGDAYYVTPEEAAVYEKRRKEEDRAFQLWWDAAPQAEKDRIAAMLERCFKFLGKQLEAPDEPESEER